MHVGRGTAVRLEDRVGVPDRRVRADVLPDHVGHRIVGPGGEIPVPAVHPPLGDRAQLHQVRPQHALCRRRRTQRDLGGDRIADTLAPDGESDAFALLGQQPHDRRYLVGDARDELVDGV